MVYRYISYTVFTIHQARWTFWSSLGRVSLYLGQDCFQSAIARFRLQAQMPGTNYHLTLLQHPPYQRYDLGLKLFCLGFLTLFQTTDNVL
jgi:hypothetical protein